MSYITHWFISHGHRSTERDVRRPRRPYPARDSRPPRDRRTLGHRARRAVRDEPAGGLEAFERARTGGPDRARARRPVAALPARGEAAQGRRRLGRALSHDLGTAFQPPRHLPAATQSEGETTWP